MIKVGIVGAESISAGELFRLLLLHPEVEILTACAPALKGLKVDNFHKGIIGETELNFTEVVIPQDLNVIFLTSASGKKSLPLPLPEELRVIEVSDGTPLLDETAGENLTFIPAVSEMYRKPLVRGTRAARIEHTAVTLTLIALFPLALNLLLNDSVDVSVHLPAYKSTALSDAEFKTRIQDLLKQAQLSLPDFRSARIHVWNAYRGGRVDVTMDCKIELGEIAKLYEQVYEDHNFTFIIDHDPTPEEVAGTQKCLIYLSKPTPETLKISAVADAVLRGGVGDAIHAMNLLFGLFEKTGLSFPATMVFKDYNGIK